MAPTADKFVDYSLKTIGIESRTTGYPPHSLILGFVNALRCICDKGAVWLVAKTMLNIRSRALRKKESGSKIEDVPAREEVSATN